MRHLPLDRRAKNRRFSALVLLSCMTLTVYFAHHAMYGRFGIEANRDLSASARALSDRLAALSAERDDLTRDIALLRRAPHPDIIEEAARQILGYAYPDTRLISEKR